MIQPGILGKGNTHLVPNLRRSTRKDKHGILAISGVQIVGSNILTTFNPGQRVRGRDQRNSQKEREDSLEKHLVYRER